MLTLLTITVPETTAEVGTGMTEEIEVSEEETTDVEATTTPVAMEVVVDTEVVGITEVIAVTMEDVIDDTDELIVSYRTVVVIPSYFGLMFKFILFVVFLVPNLLISVTCGFYRDSFAKLVTNKLSLFSI